MTVRNLLNRLVFLLCLGALMLPIDTYAQGGGEASDKFAVSGVVVDEAGQPVLGASILEKGTFNGTISDHEGKFSIKVAPNAVLEVSFMGYATQDIPVGGKTWLNVVMAEDSQLLQEVVVVGYGTAKKVNLTGAVSVVKAEDLQDRSALSASKMLQGTVPGLNITNASGRPGQSSTINIRGLNSINGGSPLILIDGAEGDLERINPADIESISVLKDASSAAIYGARASFGVILVTTKAGAGEDGKAVVRYSGRYGFTAPTTSTDFETRGYYHVYLVDSFYKAYAGSPYTGGMYTDEDMMELWIRRNDKTENPARPWVVVENRNGQDVYNYYANTDWWHHFFNDIKPTTSHNVSVSGNSGKVKFLLSGAYNKETGVFRISPDVFEKYNFRSKLSTDVNKWISISNNTSFYSSNYSYPGRSGINNSFNMSMVHALASYPVANPDGTAIYTTQYNNAIMDGLATILTNDKHRNIDKNTYFSTMTELVIKPLKNFEVRANFTYNHLVGAYTNRSANNEYSEVPGVVETLKTDYFVNRLTESYSAHNYRQANVYATYNDTFADAHNLKIMAGYTTEAKHLKDVKAIGENILSDTLSDLNLVGTNADGEKITDVSGGQNEYAIQSVFARINYDYKERYLFELNGRFDGTSRFAAGSRWGFFPSASAAWRISEEEFFERTKEYVDNLKLRASYGRLGNQQVGYYDYIRGVNLGTLGYVFGGTKPVYATLDDPVASNLTWEVVEQYNVGIDASFFGSKLNATAEAYIRDTKGMLTKGITLPGVYGADEPEMNAADMRTKGYEITLSWRDRTMLAGRPFGYGVSVVFSDYLTKITKFDNPDRLLSDYYEGQTYGEIWGYVTDGFFVSDEEAKNWHIDQTSVSGLIYESSGDEYGLRAGDLKYVDLDGNNKISIGQNTVDDPGDRKIIGNSQPRYHYGLNLSADWMGFDVSVMFQGVGRADWYPNTNATLFWGPYSQPYTSFIPADFTEKIWSEENPNSYFPRPRGYIALKTNRTLGATNDRYLQNAGYCRLKNLTVGYTIPDRFLRKANISQLRIYFSGENLAYASPMKKNTKYIDPEQAMMGNTRIYPWQKTYMFGVDLSF